MKVECPVCHNGPARKGCDFCGGDGFAEQTETMRSRPGEEPEDITETACETCGGSGRVLVEVDKALAEETGFPETEGAVVHTDCPACGGSGQK